MCIIPGSEADSLAHQRIDELTHWVAHDDSPQLLFERGHANKQVGHLAAAVDDFSRVVRDQRSDTALAGRAYYFLGVCHRRRGEVDAAMTAADMAVVLDPGNASVVGHRGYIRSMMGRHTEASADYAEALRLAPHLGVTYAFRGNGWFWQSRYQDAVDDYTQLIDEHGDDLLFKVFHDRAAARLMLGDLTGAIADLDRAEQLRPSDPWYPRDSRPLGLRAFAHLVSGDLGRCAIDLHKSAHLGINDVATITHALLEARLGRCDELRHLLEAALREFAEGPVVAAQLIAQLVDDPISFLPRLTPLIG